jgi:hypothetical protein
MKKIITLAVSALLGNAAFSQVGSQTFTSSGTFTVPPGVISIAIEVVGGGGDGGGNGGGGGGGGGYSNGLFSVTPSSMLVVTIGGSGGGNTSVGALISATGGGNGVSVSNPNIGGGGAGGVGSGGSVNYTGGTGGGGYWTYFGGGGAGAAGAAGNGSNGGNTIIWTGQCQTPGGASGASGGTPGGAGGKGAGFTDVNCNVSDPAGAAGSYGGGGGGGNGNGGNPTTGSPGVCIITWTTNGMNVVNPQYNFSVLQNPFTNKITVQHTNGNENYVLQNSIGQIIWAGKHIEEADFSWLSNGVYFLKVENETSIKTLKLLKE